MSSIDLGGRQWRHRNQHQRGHRQYSQANKGMRLSVIPGQRMHTIVARRLTAVPMLPKPETSTAIVQ